LFDLEEGKFDPKVNENESESASKDIKEEADGENGAIDSPKLEKKEDDDFNDLGGDDDPTDNDLRFEANGKGSHDSKGIRSDEVAVYPEGNQVMIRTIPPDIGRVKLEAVSVPMYC
jgi:hypothetical protein